MYDCRVPSAVVGGSSAVNTCIALRGKPEDFDEWSEYVPEWSWESCLPAFKRLEHDLDFTDDFHGSSGPLPIRRHRPEVLVLTNFDLRWGFGGFNMSDHRVVGLAALDAARDAGNRWIFPELIDDGLEPWSGVRIAAVGASPRPTHFVDVTATIDRGVASLGEHRAYLAGLGEDATDPDGFLRGNAARVGERCGVAYAVEFEVIPL